MTPFAHYDWPFFDAADAALARRVDDWAGEHHLAARADTPDANATLCRELVHLLGADGWLAPLGKAPRLRTLCVLREVLARHSDLADFCLAMQGLGTHAIATAGSEAQRESFLLPALRGEHVAGFALSEPEAGSDIGAVALRARRDGAHYVLDGSKAWISNAGLADYYIVIARTEGDEGPLGLSALIVPATTAGLSVEAAPLLSPRPFGSLHLRGCRVPAWHRIGDEGMGFRLALQTLDFYRPSVGAAALGMARRAAAEAVRWASQRRVGGKLLAEQQLAKHKLAHMAADLEASALLVARAAWLADRGEAFAPEGALAKWQATERAQQVVDTAVQLLGARGMLADGPACRAYREVRSLRIYEGTSDMQALAVAQHLVRAHRARRATLRSGE